MVALAQLGRAVPFLAANLGAAVALVFIAIPFHVSWKRGEDMSVFGFTMDPVRKSIVYAAGVVLIVFPLFLGGFVLFYDVVCADSAPHWMSKLALPGFCARWDGWGGLHAPALGWRFFEVAFVQIAVVALPEELFFRGFIHKYCEEALPPRRRFLGGGIGWAVVISSALFAVGHLAVGLDPHRLAVFFPGLMFGWLRSATGSIFAGVIAHAASNLLIDILNSMFF